MLNFAGHQSKTSHFCGGDLSCRNSRHNARERVLGRPIVICQAHASPAVCAWKAGLQPTRVWPRYGTALLLFPLKRYTLQDDTLIPVSILAPFCYWGSSSEAEGLVIDSEASCSALYCTSVDRISIRTILSLPGMMFRA